MDNNYIGWLENDSKHSLDRAKERAGLNEKRARKMMELARKRGVRSEQCRWTVDRTFLESKCNDEVEAVAYNGYCFILQRQTLHCITVFALPKDFGKKKTYYGNNECRDYQIYERFYRVDKSHSRDIGGTGLGLAITRNAILMHRGSIKATSKEEEGTTFTVKIPLSYIA